MANIGGKKRSASERDSPEYPEAVGTEEGCDEVDETSPSAPKKPALSGFNFRPSLLQQATKGFSLKQSSLPSLSMPKVSTSGESSGSNAATPLQGGFLKMDADELKPVTMDSVRLGMPAASTAFRSPTGGGSANSIGARSPNQVNHSTGHSNNLFLQFLDRANTANSFSSLSSTSAAATPLSVCTTATDTPTTNSISTNEEGSTFQEGNQSEEVGIEGHFAENSNNEGVSGVDAAGMPISFQGASAIFPEVQTVTGEEKERKIVQVPARLYVFDVVTHTWKERGRGEVRLNDAAQSEGLFQSRLVMRTSGSYRLLLNTHLWAQMKCDRANQKSIRITAQHGDHGEVGVFLIMGSAKDIQQLFTAIDRRIEALKRNVGTDVERDGAKSEKDAAQISFDDDDKESFLDEPHSSPDSSPDCHVSTRSRLAPSIKAMPITKTEEKGEVEGSKQEGENREKDGERVEEAKGGLSVGSDGGEGATSDRESTTATPSSSRSPSLGASTTTISSSDNAPEQL